MYKIIARADGMGGGWYPSRTGGSQRTGRSGDRTSVFTNTHTAVHTHAHTAVHTHTRTSCCACTQPYAHTGRPGDGSFPPHLVRRLRQPYEQSAPGTHQLPLGSPRGFQHQRRAAPVLALRARTHGEGGHHGVGAGMRAPRDEAAGARAPVKRRVVEAVGAQRIRPVAQRVAYPHTHQTTRACSECSATTADRRRGSACRVRFC